MAGMAGKKYRSLNNVNECDEHEVHGERRDQKQSRRPAGERQAYRSPCQQYRMDGLRQLEPEHLDPGRNLREWPPVDSNDVWLVVLLPVRTSNGGLQGPGPPPTRSPARRLTKSAGPAANWARNRAVATATSPSAPLAVAASAICCSCGVISSPPVDSSIGFPAPVEQRDESVQRDYVADPPWRHDEHEGHGRDRG